MKCFFLLLVFFAPVWRQSGGASSSTSVSSAGVNEPQLQKPPRPRQLPSGLSSSPSGTTAQRLSSSSHTHTHTLMNSLDVAARFFTDWPSRAELRRHPSWKISPRFPLGCFLPLLIAGPQLSGSGWLSVVFLLRFFRRRHFQARLRYCAVKQSKLLFE